MKKIEKIKFSSLLFILAAAIFLAYTYDFNIDGLFKELKSLAMSNPVWAAIAFVLLFSAAKFAFVPIASASILAGYVFGVYWGMLISLIAIAFSSSLMFWLARLLGKNFFEKLIAERFDRIQKYNHLLQKHGLLTMLFFRVVPVFPLIVINIGLGLSKAKFKDYLLATIFGTLPGVLLLANAGQYLTDWDNPKLYIYLGIYLLMIGAAFYAAYKIRKKANK